MHVGTRIKELITDRDIKQKMLANKIGVNPSSFSNYITGSNKMPFDVFVSVADYLDVSTDYLLGRTDHLERPLELSSSERELILALRSLGREDKEFIVQSVHLLVEKRRK